MLKDTLGPTFRALADPTRRWYLECLLDGDVRLREFRDLFPLSAQTVVHHLRVLEECGLLRSRKEGPMRLYSLQPEPLEEVDAWLRSLRLSDYQAGRCSPLRYG